MGGSWAVALQPPDQLSNNVLWLLIHISCLWWTETRQLCSSVVRTHFNYLMCAAFLLSTSNYIPGDAEVKGNWSLSESGTVYVCYADVKKQLITRGTVEVWSWRTGRHHVVSGWIQGLVFPFLIVWTFPQHDFSSWNTAAQHSCTFLLLPAASLMLRFCFPTEYDVTPLSFR